MIELKIEQPAAIAFAEEEVRRAAAGNAQVLSDLRARLPGLGLEVRNRWKTHSRFVDTVRAALLL